MLKDNGKNIIVLLLIVIGTFLVFIAGVEIFQQNIPYDTSFTDKQQITIFDKLILSNERENWLIPIGTFFSALSALATVYLIWLQQQTIKKHDLEVETERVISHFFILLNNHRTIVNNLKFPIQILNEDYHLYKEKNYIDSIATGYKAIEFCLKTIEVSINNNFHNISNQNHNILPIKNIDIPNELSKKIKSIKIDWSKKGEKIDFMKEYNNNYKDIFLFILEKTFNIIDYHTSYCTAQYFHNIYSMLILLNDNRKKINIESYLRTLRAEFNQEELLFIYYYACIRNANNIKFKSLVEDTCLFHNLNNERLDHDPLHDKPFVLYGKSAFTH